MRGSENLDYKEAMEQSKVIYLKTSTPIPDDLKSDFEKIVYHLNPAIRNAKCVKPESIELEVSGDINENEMITALNSAAEKITENYRPFRPQPLFRFGDYDIHISPDTLMEEMIMRGLVYKEGRGCYQLSGLCVKLLEYVDAQFLALATDEFHAVNEQYPSLIGKETLVKGGYADSFPQLLNFVYHLHEDYQGISRFRNGSSDMSPNELKELLSEEDKGGLCLSPAICYHRYQRLAKKRLNKVPVVTSRGKCFRYESGNMKDLSRIREFTMREIIFIGNREEIADYRERFIRWLKEFVERIGINALLSIANDPFFIETHAQKRYFQMTGKLKYELQALLNPGNNLAIASLNIHNNYFSKAFGFTGLDGTDLESACVGFGLERWVYAFWAQFGFNYRNWPEEIRNSVFC